MLPLLSVSSVNIGALASDAPGAVVVAVRVPEGAFKLGSIGVTKVVELLSPKLFVAVASSVCSGRGPTGKATL